MTSSATQNVHRSNQAWFERISDRETLDFGIAFFSERYANYGGANQLREVVLDDVPIEQAWDQCEAFFNERGPSCLRWVPAITQPPEPMEPFLIERGYRRVESRVLQISSWIGIAGGEDLRVVPARAVRQAYAEFCGEQADLSIDRLDDPGLEMSVAIIGPSNAAQTRVIGRLGFFQIGDIGRVRDLSVRPDSAETGVAPALMRHVLNFARRMDVRSVCAEIRATDTEQLSLHQKCGFEDCGSLVRFER